MRNSLAVALWAGIHLAIVAFGIVLPALEGTH